MMEVNATAAVAAPAIGGSPEAALPPGKEQQVAGTGILLQISMLVLAFILGHLLRRHKFYYLPEASASLLIVGMQELGTDVNLYALVFGESVLNDAMAIFLYRTMSSVRSTDSPGQNFFLVVLRFLEIFVGSMTSGVGVGVGFVPALISFSFM